MKKVLQVGDRVKPTVLLAVAIACCVSSLWSADTWYADAVNGNDAWNGTRQVRKEGTLNGPKQTLQEAVDCANAGDTVVALPGVYRTGGKTDVWNTDAAKCHKARVLISKKITLKSLNGRATRDTTVILGEHDATTEGSADLGNGTGDNAVRCLAIASAANGTVVEGLTLKDGATRNGGDSNATSGGGAMVQAVSSGVEMKTVLCDCVFVNCVGTRGGAMRNGIAVRCLFDGNRSANAKGGGGGGSACREVHLYNSIFTRNSGSQAIYYPFETVNCTFFANTGSANHATTGYPGPFVNCVFVGCDNSSEYTPQVALTNCVTKNSSGSVTLPSENCQWEADVFQFVAPMLNDFRPLAHAFREGAVLEGNGNAELLASYPEEFCATDYFGNPRVVDGKVDVGAVQGAVTPTGGRLRFKAQGESVDGRVPFNGNEYAYGSAERRQITIDCASVWKNASGLALFCVQIMNGETVERVRIPDKDWRVTMMLPAANADKDLCINLNYFARPVYADANTTEATADQDGSAEHPFKTLSQAQAKYDSRIVVFCKPGDYSTETVAVTAGGGTFNCRLSVQKHLALRAVEGPDNTFITGAPDSETGGSGPNAVRCVHCNTSMIFGLVGFTLRNGYSREGSSDGILIRGGGFTTGAGGFTTDLTQQLIGCVITNCHAGRTAAAWGGWLQKCLIVDNRNNPKSNANGILRCGAASSCLFVNNDPIGNGVIGQSGRAYGCTFDNADEVNANSTVADAFVFNSLLTGRTWTTTLGTTTAKVLGCVADTSCTLAADDRIECEKASDAIFFADRASRDYRLVGLAPISGKGNAGADDLDIFTIDYYNGNKTVFSADGKPAVGAFQTAASAVVVTCPAAAGATVVTTNVVEEGGSVEIADATHPVRGFEVNGELVEAETPYAGYRATYPGAGEALRITVVPSPDWYVTCDATKGDDANDGFCAEPVPGTAHGPKLTLAAACSNAFVRSGDVIHAAPGVYDQGEVTQTHAFESNLKHADDDQRTVPCRAIVPVGVTLKGDAGPAETFIEGAKDMTETGDATYRCGPMGVRGLLMESGSAVEGFTVRGCRTKRYLGASTMTGPDQYDDYSGAAILGHRRGAVRPVARNCVFSDNVTTRGGATRWVSAFDCVFSNNVGLVNCAASRDGLVYARCFFDHNRTNGGIVGYFDRMEQCTIGYDNLTTAGTSCSPFVLQTGAKVFNSVLCGQWNALTVGGSTDTIVVGAISNNLFSSSVENATVTFAASAPAAGDNRIWNRSVAMIGDDGVPQKGSPAIDAAKTEYNAEPLPATDVRGGQRVYNAAADLGAFEYDYRPDFSKALGSRFIVDAADPVVRLRKDGETVVGVELPSGSMSGHWRLPPNETSMTVSISQTVEGDGQLAITNAGEAFAGRGEVDADHNAFSFVFTPEADGAVALLNQFRTDRGLIFLVK